MQSFIDARIHASFSIHSRGSVIDRHFHSRRKIAPPPERILNARGLDDECFVSLDGRGLDLVCVVTGADKPICRD
jgi:hypothetical protein